jgi:arogenate dehydrogenase (NADP+)
VKIGIIGLGLIGGSIGLDLRDRGYQVLGVSQRSTTCETAVAIGAVDSASQDLASLREADVIFICTPIGLIRPTVVQLVPHLRSETVLTDVGSVKRSIVAEIAPLWPNFVGGHPMAGTAESGINAALRGLFVGNPYVLTPMAETPPQAVASVRELISQLGGKYLECLPEVHDRSVAWISHLPVMVSASLIAACEREVDPAVAQLAIALASSGFRDTSRVGGGNPELGRMMAEFNRSALLETLQGYRSQLDQMIELIQSEQWSSVETILQKTQVDRPKYLKES